MRVTIVLMALLVVGGIFATANPETGTFAASAWSGLEAPAEPAEPPPPETTTTAPAPPADPTAGCATPTTSAPTGRLVTGTYASESAVTVEVEDGLAIDPDCVADLVVSALGSSVGDVTVTVVSPEMVARLCAPLDTTGLATCWNGSRALIDADRWLSATPEQRLALVRSQVEAAVGTAVG